MRSISKLILLTVLCAGFSANSFAQLQPNFFPLKPQCCTAIYGQRLADSLKDWPMLSRYHEEDQKLAAVPPEGDRVVFMGDSITDFWNLSKSFPGKPYLNRGISGQTTPQMVLRVFPDVIKLHPAAVVILASTNDIAGNTGPETPAMIEDNFRAMVELAQLHGIKIILCTVTPVSDYTRSKQTPDHPAVDILKINEWLKQYAREVNAEVADYYSVLVDPSGMLREGLSNDGLHPNESGYALMAPGVEAAIQRTLK